MAARFKKSTPTEAWHTLPLTGGESLDVLIVRPDYAAVLEDFALLASGEEGQHIQHRIRAAVADWRDITDEAGKPVPYKFEHLAEFIVQHPAMLVSLLTLANEAFRPVEAPAAKNSEALPTDSSQAAEINAA